MTDVKSATWLDPNVRLTEISLWYPVVPRTGTDDSWPPAPAVATLTLPRLEGLSWVTSGQKQADGTYVVDFAGELEITAVPFAATHESVGTIAIDVHSPRAEAIAAHVKPLLAALASHLGETRTGEVMAIVEYPAISQNWLSFASSDLLLFDSSSTDGLVADEARATEIWAHELGHVWIGRSLHPEGRLSRWLSESFAEYYAWRAIAKLRGDAEVRGYVARAEDDTEANKMRIDALAEDDNRLYTRGALAVRALTAISGESRFDGALRSIAAAHQPFTVANLFAALASAGVDDDALAKYRATWGV